MKSKFMHRASDTGARSTETIITAEGCWSKETLGYQRNPEQSSLVLAR